jgi:hypothetical protein
VYNDKSNRLWHPLQNYRREYKKQILDDHGYCYHYDIECCAFNLIYQHSQRLPEPMDLYLPALTGYLANRDQIRQHLAGQAEIPEAVVKRLINALLAGAPLSTNPTHEICQMLQSDRARIEFFKQSEFIVQLRADIKICWDYIKPTLPRRSITTQTGRQRMLPISSRQKWGLYFDLERQVLNQIRYYLNQNHNRHFLEHDGWSCSDEVNVTELTAHIKKTLGFNLNFQQIKGSQ